MDRKHPHLQPASRFNDYHLHHANLWKSQQETPLFRTYHAAEYVLPSCDFGPPSPFPPYLLRFTQLLLTEKATYCHQLSPVTGLPLQQQESQALCLTHHNCLAPAPISDIPFLLDTSLPTRRIPMPFSLESYKAFKDLCKGKSCSHTPAHSRGLSIQSIYLKHPTVTLRLSCFSRVLRQLVHK